MSLRVLTPGLQTLIVDQGRPGSRRLGLPIGGAADRTSWAIGNAMLGNAPEDAALEVAGAGPMMVGDAPVAAVLMGAPFVISTDRRTLEPGQTFVLEPGETLRIGGAPRGMRAYLCVAGGIQTPHVLGSRSSLHAVTTGDILPCNSGQVNARRLADARFPRLPMSPIQSFRVVPGAQFEWFNARALEQQEFTVGMSSNRMGIRLSGAPLPRDGREMTSEPVCPGTIQIANDGQCIILGIDGQAIGGYPKIAHVISADLDLLGQLRPGDRIRFVHVPLDVASTLARESAQQLNRLLAHLRAAGTRPV